MSWLLITLGLKCLEITGPWVQFSCRDLRCFVLLAKGVSLDILLKHLKNKIFKFHLLEHFDDSGLC